LTSTLIGWFAPCIHSMSAPRSLLGSSSSNSRASFGVSVPDRTRFLMTSDRVFGSPRINAWIQCLTRTVRSAGSSSFRRASCSHRIHQGMRQSVVSATCSASSVPHPCALSECPTFCGERWNHRHTSGTENVRDSRTCASSGLIDMRRRSASPLLTITP
jgi:hypothetical protein